MIGRTNANAGGSRIFATIAVTYPAGSVCTCTDGSKTITAKGTAGAYAFEVPYAGNWTVRSVNGAHEASETVTVDVRDHRYEAELKYMLYLIQAGVKIATPTLTRCTTTAGSGYLKFTASNYQHFYAWFSAIDLTVYNKLVIEYTAKLLFHASYGGSGIGVASQTPTPAEVSDVSTIYIKSARILRDTGAETVTLDISQITGEKYIGVDAEGSTEDTRYYSVSNLYLST